MSEKASHIIPVGADGGLDDEDDDNEVAGGRPLAWIISRLSFIARHLVVNRPLTYNVYLSQVCPEVSEYFDIAERISCPDSLDISTHGYSAFLRRNVRDPQHSSSDTLPPPHSHAHSSYS
jgi:hypothetical protein